MTTEGRCPGCWSLDAARTRLAVLEAENARLKAALFDRDALAGTCNHLRDLLVFVAGDLRDTAANIDRALRLADLTSTGRPVGTGRSLEGSSAVEERTPGAGEPPKETP